jgi:5-methylcytosine-specific restriction endonuclease McrA
MPMPWKDKERQREYQREYQKKYQKEHPEKRREWAKRSRQNLRETDLEGYKQQKRQDYLKYRKWYVAYAKKRSAITFHTRRKQLIQKLGAKCNDCGFTEYPEILEIHHLDKNRENNLVNNLVLLCPTCHSLRHRKNLYSPKE